MLTRSRRALARKYWPVGLAALLLAHAAAAAEVLTLAQAQRLAMDGQPQLQAQAAQVRAFDARAVSARELPDPQLVGGIENLPVSGSDAYSLRRDDFTAFTIGVMQEFPLASKRELRGEKQRLMALGAQDQLKELQRRIRRETGLAYLELYLPEKAEGLIEAMLEEGVRSQRVAEIAYRAGRVEQADVLSADVSLALLRDKQAEYQQMAEHARRHLARWIGPAADDPVDLSAPAFVEPPALDTILAALPRHPAVQIFERSRDVAQNGIAQARQAYKPDWRVELGYGHRVDYSDMVSLRVGVDLPVFTRHRQDSEVSAARDDAAQADSQHDDALRDLVSQASIAHHDWTRLAQRVSNFDDVVLPQARARVDAATISYGAGRGTLAALLDARRSLLDVQLQRLTLAVDALRNRLALEYFIGDAP